MTTFQLDQNVDTKSLSEKCNAEGLAQLLRFPSKWKDNKVGFKDPQLIPIVMNDDKPLITNDRRMPKAHEQIIPQSNPGMIVVGLERGISVKTLTTKDIEKIFTNFKKIFPKWNSVYWSNSIVHLTEKSVEVSRIKDGKLQFVKRFQFDEKDWQIEFEKLLKNNSRRIGPETD